MSLAAVFVLVALLYGSAYAFPALVPLIAAELGGSRVALGAAFGVYLLVVAGSGPLAGSMVLLRPNLTQEERALTLEAFRPMLQSA
jgi:C4-dicarboxylate transporter